MGKAPWVRPSPKNCPRCHVRLASESALVFSLFLCLSIWGHPILLEHGPLITSDPAPHKAAHEIQGLRLAHGEDPASYKWSHLTIVLLCLAYFI